MKLEYKPRFIKAYKKLTKDKQKAVTAAVDQLLEDPTLGIQKKGDLSHIFVYKFRYQRQEYLIGYTYDPETMTLVAVGVHENFYRDLKR
ncbi:MAG: type II toxin-antitoxin system RelE/ParE family toxin [Lentisphaerales bacterium]|nr:type II toxin-antitoxin system RelE/ParE family toxin [Lentisphaerales bacterium]